MSRLKTWIIVLSIAAYAAVVVVGGLPATGAVSVRANFVSPECRADEDQDGLISHQAEAVSAIGDYLLVAIANPGKIAACGMPLSISSKSIHHQEFILLM